MTHLPTPPTESEKYAYINQGKWTLYSFGLFSFAALLTGMILFAIRHQNLYWFLAFVLFIAFYLGLSYGIGVFGETFDLEKHHGILERHGQHRPAVDIFLPNCGEDLDVLRNTFRHVKNLDWEPLCVYVMDDIGREEVQRLAEEFKFKYLCRPNRGELKKAGNLRYAFARSAGQFIAVLDADFAPRRDFIRELIPYFFHDEQIAIVQSPQFFEILPGQPWIQKGAAYVQELFYRLIQVNRNTWGASVCVGTNAIYRRKSLEPFGGTAPIPYSEDLHTGFQILEANEKVHYVPVNLAKGLCPNNPAAFFLQQYRWATGSTSLALSRRFWHARIPAIVRLSYLSGMLYYAATALGLFLTPLPSILMVWLFPDRVFWYNALFSVPSFVYGTVYLALWTKAPFGWYAVRARTISYFAHVVALADKLRNRTISWVPTGSVNVGRISKFAAFRNLLILWTAISAGFIYAGCASNMAGLGDYHFYPMLFFATLNLFTNVSVVFPRDVHTAIGRTVPVCGQKGRWQTCT